MRTALLSVLTLIIPLAVSAQTADSAKPAPPKATPECLRQNRIWGWKVTDSRTLIVTDNSRKTFTVSVRPGCLDLQRARSLDFRTFGNSGASCLRRNDYVLVPPFGSQRAQRCIILDVVAYAPPPAQ